jgi:dienelactone hydrolase
MRLRLVRTTAFAAAVAATVAAPLALAGGPTATAADQARAMLAGYAGRLPASYQAPPVGVDPQCFAPAGHPDPQVDSSGHPTNPVWIRRDEVNQYCALLRIRDQLASPAFGYGNLTVGGQLYAQQAEEQAADGPNHVHGGITTLIPGSQGADPFRSVDRWQRLTGGRETEVRFRSLDGAQLRGHIWLPPKSVPKPRGGYPGVVITDGSIQAYENLYYWAAEGLAQYGYEVMTYDVQGQGDSDLFPANCSPSSCTGVPYQQNYNFYQGAEDSLSFFLSKANPYADALNRNRVAIAGHSLGAAAVSVVGQCDNRVKTIVAWDNLNAITDCSGVTIPARYRSKTLIHAPALALTNDYLFNPQPQTAPPDPHAKDAGYKQIAAAGLDAQIVTFRNATHLTYSYIPVVLPANELSERMASYYTRAWLDLELRHQASGYRRLVAKTFDASADRHSIGAGLYDPSKADPKDPYAGNVPYTIAGIKVADAVSFYYESAYALHDPSGSGVATCVDMRAGCPAKEPPTP